MKFAYADPPYFKQGKKLGKKLEFLKASWIKNNFKLNFRNI